MSRNAFQLGHARRSDLEIICEIAELSFTNRTCHQSFDFRYLESFFEVLDEPILVVKIGREIVGFLMLHSAEESRDGRKAGWLSWLAVRPEWRGRGIGATLTSEALQYLRSRQVARIRAYSRDDNVAANALLEANGFRRQPHWFINVPLEAFRQTSRDWIRRARMDNGEHSIRRIDERDFEDLLNLRFLGVTFPESRPLQPAFDRTYLSFLKRLEPEGLLSLTVRNELAGFAVLQSSWHHADYGKNGWIFNPLVRSELYVKGYWSLLMRSASRYFQFRGVRVVSFVVPSDSPHLKTLGMECDASPEEVAYWSLAV